jgi:Protein of unknown function (DUF2851)
MRENFLHFLWRWRRFDAADLCTLDGQPLTILHPGELNTDAGPDFFNARLRIGDTEWAGNVEMHLRASEWLTHQHQHDRAYDNVVLHVVLEADQPILRASGEPLPCLSLAGRIPPNLLAQYERLEQQRSWIPCAHAFGDTPEIVRLNWYDRLLVERLEAKTTDIAARVEHANEHWEEAFYQALARSYGLKVNAEPFEALARSLPLSVLARHKNNLLQLEALLFGQAGLLEGSFQEAYPAELAKEYQFLRHKYQLTPLDGSSWKFLRLRPANFPTVRLAQFAALVHQSAHLFSKITEATSVRSLEHLFAAPTGEYWLTHYQFDKPSAKRAKAPGRDFIQLLLINTVVPMLFQYGKARQLPDLQDRALRLLEELPAEANATIDGWAALGVVPANAYRTQALLQLKAHYCDERRCLSCAVGHSILKDTNNT